MLQFIPLLIELFLLAAVAYIYWRTRQLLANSRLSASPFAFTGEPAETKNPTTEIRHAEMMEEVANLLTEWQGAANATRQEWLQQQAHLQEILQQAEAKIAELQHLLIQADLSADKSREEKSDPSPAMLQGHWTEAIAAFGEQLRTNGYTQNTITRTLGHVEKFADWWVSQTVVEDAAPPQNEDEFKSTGANPLPPDSVELDKVPRGQPFYPNHLAGKMPPAQGADRYRAVFALAEQGLDPATITAETGLEREAVRLLLANYGTATACDIVSSQ